MTILSRSLVAAALAASLGAPAYAQTTEINFGIISTESQQNLKTLWDPFLAAMAEDTGLTINPFFASDYAGVIEGMRFGQVQLAWYGNASAMQAVDRANGEVFAQTVSVEGNPGYWSLLITQADSPLENLEDVLACDGSLDMGIGDPNSTSGFLVPTTFIFAQEGIDPRECFNTVRNANHETNAMAVAMGQVDIATNNTESMTRLQETNPEAFAKIKEIWRSPLIPSDPIVWGAELDEASKDKLFRFFMSYGRMGTPEEVTEAREILAALGWAPFRPSSNAQLYPVRIMEITREMFEIEADTGIAAEEKAAQLEALQTQKSEFEDLMARVPQT